MNFRHPSPEIQHWRWCVLNALDLVQLWGHGPVSRDEWVRRYRPGYSPRAQDQAWVRMKRGLRSLGLALAVGKDGVTLPRGSVDRVRRWAEILDEWLLEQSPLSGRRAERLDWEIRDHSRSARQARLA